ncbi:hypothetical protein IG511_16400 [Vibrio cholerae]|uniref:lipopolysaccharide biosynthesis protein n=2 Tax=Vibrio cholerae TaxID=666 RepID=UPI00227045E4|nr:hypothetical protein [Vibrio cholerae]MCX9490517.1 hypothetical protein [Vibrio cholerae]MCX9520918.1 hypothetical protein [Vibrio cholerae]
MNRLLGGKVFSFILFGLTAIFNRGTLLLLLPISALSLSISDVGLLSVLIIGSQLLIPIVTLNASSIIGREFYDNRSDVDKLVNLVNITLFSFSVLAVVLLAFDVLVGAFAFLVILECLFLINATFVRFRDGPIRFFIGNLIKFLMVFLFGSLLWALDSSWLEYVESYLFLIVASNAFSVIYFGVSFNHVACNDWREFFGAKKHYFIFSLGLIPHIISQWAISGFDRIYIGDKHGESILGLYSLGYSLSSMMMFYVSALAIGLPFFCVKDYKLYCKESNENYIILIASTLCFFLILILDWVVPHFYHHLDYQTVLDIVYILVPSFVCLSVYHYHAADLFFNKDVGTISKITFSIAALNVIFVVVLSELEDVSLVAFATLMSYILYMIVSAYFSSRTFRVWKYGLVSIFTVIPALIRLY